MILTFTVSLPRDYILDDAEPWKASLELHEDTTLEDFHGAIQQAVGFANDHLFAFFVAKSERSNERTWFDDEHGGLNQSLGNLFPLPQGQRLFYLFDFGDNWLFKISKSRKQPRSPEDNIEYPRVVKEVGDRPMQYPDWDEDYESVFGDLSALDEDIDEVILPPVPLPDLQESFTMPIMQSHCMGLFEAAGFTLATISAPKNIPFSEWAPRLFEGEVLPAFSSLEETEKVTTALLELWNHWAESINGGFGLPPECSTDEDNRPSDALREFCDGYMKAHSWLDSLWNDLVFQDVLDFAPEDESLMEEAENQETMDLLVTYALLSEAGDFYSSSENINPENPDDEFLDDIFEISFNLLPALMLDIALFGRHFDNQSMAANFPASFDADDFADFDGSSQAPLPFSTPETYISPEKLGRNDPCPCGSGKKFKKCCLH